MEPRAMVDTTEEARRVQAAALHAMGPERRTELAIEMSDDVRRVTLEGLRERHPDLTERELVDLLIMVWHGQDREPTIASA